MSAFDLARFLWPDGYEGRQPQDASIRAEISGVPASFLLLPSVGFDDLAGNAAKTVTGAMVRSSSGVMVAKSTLFTDNANRIKWAKRTSRDELTVVFYGYLSSLSTASSCHLFGQFQPNSSAGTAAVYDWSIYESGPADGVFFQVSNGTTALGTQPVAAPTWVAFKPRCVAASFNKGVVKISVDGGPVTTASTAVSQLAANWDIASGGYWGAQSGYNPGIRTALAATFDDYAAQDAELRSLSANPWSMFVAPVDVGWPIAASVGGSYALAAVGISTADGSATPSVNIPLSAAGFSVSGGGANALATITISAAGLAQAAGSATLNITVALNATGSSQSSGSANLSGGAPGQVSASGGAQAGGSAQIKATVSISAAGYAQAMASGQLSIHIPLSAFGGAVSAGTAHLVDVGGSLILTRAPAGQGPLPLAAEGYRPQLSSQCRPANTGGRRL